jgi:hypothetical protein
VESGIDGLRTEARRFKSMAFATATKKSYQTHLRTYLRFCFYYNLCPVPASQEVLTCYVAHLGRSLSPSSVAVYLNIILFLHEETGFVNPLCKNYEVDMVKRGLQRVKGVPPKQKAPMTVPIMLSMYSHLRLEFAEDKAFWCALLIGFFGYLRKSSLVPASSVIPQEKRLNRSDVSHVTLDSFFLTLRHSKTNQFGRRTHSIPFAVCDDKRICPVFALLRHLGSSPLTGSSPLFNFVRGGVEVCYTHALFAARLKSCAESCGLDTSRFSGHSLHRSGATFSFDCGLSADQIKLRGDWRSSCYQQYLVVSDRSCLHSAHVLSSAAAVQAGAVSGARVE